MAFNILTLTTALTTTSNSFFYNDYSIKHFMTLNGLIPIETAKNIVMFMNNNAFIYGLTGSIEPGNIKLNGIELSTARHSNKVNTKNLIININFLDCHFNDNK